MEDQYKAGILPLSDDSVSWCWCPGHQSVSRVWVRTEREWQHRGAWCPRPAAAAPAPDCITALLLHPLRLSAPSCSDHFGESWCYPWCCQSTSQSQHWCLYNTTLSLNTRLNIFIWNNRGGIKPSKSVQLPKSKEGNVLVNLILPRFLSNTRLSISIIDQYWMDVKAVGNNLSAAYLPDSAEVWCLIVLCKPAAASLHTNVGMMECWVLAATATVITSSAKHPKYFHNDFHWSSLMISLALREST